jgi:hypothetical protein
MEPTAVSNRTETPDRPQRKPDRQPGRRFVRGCATRNDARYRLLRAQLAAANAYADQLHASVTGKNEEAGRREPDPAGHFLH